MKSIGSVFENNIVVDSVVGHVYQLTPYLEPAVRTAPNLTSRCHHLNLIMTGIVVVGQHGLQQQYL